MSAPLNVAGDVTLAGTLNYSALLGSNQKYFIGETFSILNYGGTLTGSFANIVGPTIPGYRVVVDYSTPNKINLVLLADLTQPVLPAFRASTTLAQSATGVFTQTGPNAITVTTANLATATSPLQNSATTLNTVGGLTTTTTSPVAVASGFSVQQSFSQPAINTDRFTQTTTNLLSAISRTAVVQGQQTVAGSVNTAALSANAGSSGQIIQAVSNQLTANAQTLTNTQTASSTSGTAQVGQSTVTGQTTEANINVATLSTSQASPGASASDLGLNQNLGVTKLDISASNAASADSSVSGSAGAKNLAQSNLVTANALNTTFGALALSGGQNATSTLNVTFGNGVTASATTGLAKIDAAPQIASLGLNSIQSSGSIAFGSSPFIQTFENQGALSITRTDATSAALNRQSASSSSGSAAIAGLQGATTQNSRLLLNSVSAGGTLSGSLSQSTSLLNVPTLANTASVSAGASAKLTDFAQSQSQTINEAAGLGGSSLSLTQTLPLAQNLSASNVQVATAGGAATLKNARQVATLGTNSATLSQIGAASTVQQSAFGSSLSQNSLVATGAASTIQSSAQSAFTFANILR